MLVLVLDGYGLLGGLGSGFGQRQLWVFRGLGFWGLGF